MRTRSQSAGRSCSAKRPASRNNWASSRRIACKQLRYATEVFTPCFGEDFAKDLYPRLKETQDNLGAINDAHMARLRLESILHDVAAHEGEDDEDTMAVERGLRSLIGRYAKTSGRAVYSMEFDSYSEVPKAVADEIVQKTKGE